MARKQGRRVTFSGVDEVHVVPRGGREMEPGYVARAARHAALKMHGLRVPRRQMDDLLGNGYGPGSIGQYTDAHASRNTWHRQKFGGTTWYKPVKQRQGTAVTVEFKSRYAKADEDRLLDDMLFDFRTGRIAYSPY